MNLLNPSHGELGSDTSSDSSPIFTHPPYAPALPLESQTAEPAKSNVEDKSQPPVKKRFTQRAYFPWLVVLGILVILLIIFSPIVIIRAGHRGVSTFFGDTQGDILSQGVHFKYPLLRVHQFDTRTQLIEVDSGVETTDMQVVKTTLGIRYRLDAAELKDLYDNYGQDYEYILLVPAAEESLVEVGAQFTAQEMINRLADFKAAYRQALEARLANSGIILEEASITDVSLSKALQDAFESRALAEQQAQEQELLTEAELAKIQQDIAAAKLETERIRILGEALKGHEAYIQYEIMKKWDGSSALYLAPATPPQVINNTIENPAP